eukprot:12297383-Ditylum_brightwellii.AAC.1
MSCNSSFPNMELFPTVVTTVSHWLRHFVALFTPQHSAPTTLSESSVTTESSSNDPVLQMDLNHYAEP